MDSNNQTAPKGGKKFPKWGWWVIGIVGAVVLVGGGYLVASSKYKTENKKISSASSTSTTSATTSSTSSASTNDYTGWKTYTNNELGMSFKYPNNWQRVTLVQNSNDWNNYPGTNWSNPGEPAMRFDPQGAFWFNIYSKDYDSAYGSVPNKEKIDANWSALEYSNKMGYSSGEILFVKKLSNKTLLIGVYYLGECTTGLTLKVLTPLNNSYPNFGIDIGWGDDKDSSILAAKEKDKQCDEAGEAIIKDAYKQAAEKIEKGTYSDDLNANIKTAQMIADSLTVK